MSRAVTAIKEIAYAAAMISNGGWVLHNLLPGQSSGATSHSVVGLAEAQKLKSVTSAGEPCVQLQGDAGTHVDGPLCLWIVTTVAHGDPLQRAGLVEIGLDTYARARPRARYSETCRVLRSDRPSKLRSEPATPALDSEPAAPPTCLSKNQQRSSPVSGHTLPRSMRSIG